MDIGFLQQAITNFPLKSLFLVSVPVGYVPNFPNEIFTVINTETSTLCAEPCIMIANSSEKVFLRTPLAVKVQFAQAALQREDARNTTVPSQLLRVRHDLCSFYLSSSAEKNLLEFTMILFLLS